jgi:prepilin-type N-terminal cleavage/methylation domain-containing protein
MSKSFTLIEILVVIVVIGIISSFIIVGLSSVSDKANIAKGQAFSNSLRNSLLMNLVSEWKLDEGTGSTTLDSWGSNTGTLGTSTTGDAAEPTWTTDCVSSKCLSFDGVDDYVSVNSVNDFNLSKTNQLTVGLWFKTNAINGTAIVIKQNEWMFYPILGNTVGFLVRGTTTWRYSSTCSNIQTNKWYHIVGVANYSGTNLNMNFYVNGVSYGETNHTTDLGTTTNSVTIGGNWTDRFNGTIDDVRIYNQAIPTSQIQQNYYSGLNNLIIKNQINIEEYSQRIRQFTLK